MAIGQVGFPGLRDRRQLRGRLAGDQRGGGSFECKFLDGPASPTARIQVEDADEAAGSTTLNSNIANKAAQVDNVAPMVVSSGADEVDEGDSETYTYTVTDPGVNDTFSVHSGFPDCDFGATKNGVLVGTRCRRGGWQLRVQLPRWRQSATVKIKVTDNDGGSRPILRTSWSSRSPMSRLR